MAIAKQIYKEDRMILENTKSKSSVETQQPVYQLRMLILAKNWALLVFFCVTSMEQSGKDS